MGGKRETFVIPSGENFIENKYISDLVYMWILLNGEKEIGGGISFPKRPRKAYLDIGINYRTFYKELQALVDFEYIEESIVNPNMYVISDNEYKFKRYVPRHIVEKIYNEKERNLFKLYIYLASLYDYNQKKGKETFFRPNVILEMLGYSGGVNRSSKMEKKIMGLVNKLVALKLITYTTKYEPTDHRYKVTYILKSVVKR